MAKAEQSVEDFKGQARLPRFANPRRYGIALRVDLARCAFSGSATIAVAVASATRFLVLNAADLAVDSASVRFTAPGSSEELQPSQVVAVEEDEILVVGFDTVLPIGDGELRMEFTGTLNDQMRGFYRSKYEYNGEIKNMAVTQFEAADARRCFPCWDEPAFKATFKITLEVPSELVALSNMPVADEKVNGAVKTLCFEESPIMSTYLVAIVVGLFDYIEDKLPDGTKVRLYSQVGMSSQGKFALDVAVKSLQLYEKYFAVPYPLPKLDMVAIPDFAAGAMENYGLVTYRETALLYDDRVSSASNKQSVAITVAHELAHQWFGNLVTMEWWTHLWLNEGFASWVSYLAVDSLFPEWKIWTQFLEDTATGLMLDALSESHPVENAAEFVTDFVLANFVRSCVGVLKLGSQLKTLNTSRHREPIPTRIPIIRRAWIRRLRRFVDSDRGAVRGFDRDGFVDSKRGVSWIRDAASVDSDVRAWTTRR